MDINHLLLQRIRSGEISTQDVLEVEKNRLAKQLGTGRVIKNAEILEVAQGSDDYEHLKKFLMTKPVRTSSGIANIAAMWKYNDLANSCPFSCIYCPQGKDDTGFIAPKSYTGVEPTTMRAIRNHYDPVMQVSGRLKQFHMIGHETDKCELIIMGGTFMCTPPSFQQDFIKKCFDAFNGEESSSLEEAHVKNECAKNRCVGLTIETRADVCLPEKMLSYGCTRVEIGVQCIDEDILKKTKRGHGVQANVEAFRKLKQAGLKVCAHWMPGLTGIYGKVDFEKEISMFKELFSSDYCPDEIKIYPTLVIPGTELHEMWIRGEFAALSNDEMILLLVEMKKIIPTYVRVKRIMRDISEKKVVAGAKTTNLRQLAQMKMQESGIRCNCIRCREIRLKDYDNYEFNLLEYEASGGKELFLSFDSGDNLLAFLRLRIDDGPAKVRELHVYGKMAPLFSSNMSITQHKGFGSMLLEKSEEIARQKGKNKIQVTSGIGVREYYRKRGYQREGYYMTKKLQ